MVSLYFIGPQKLSLLEVRTMDHACVMFAEKPIVGFVESSCDICAISDSVVLKNTHTALTIQ